MNPFGQRRPFLLAGDMIVFITALISTLAIRYREIPSVEIVNAHLVPFLFLFVLWAGVFLIVGLYDRHVLLARKRIPALVFQTQTLNVLLAAAFFFVMPFGIDPKTNLVIYLGVSSILIAIWRLYVFPRLSMEKPMTALVIGNTREAEAIVAAFNNGQYFKNVQAHLLNPASYEDGASLRAGLLDFTEREAVDMIIADLRGASIGTLGSDFYSLVFEEQSIHFYDLPLMYEQLYHRVPPSLVKEAWILENITTTAPHYAYDFLKRVVDIVGACVLLIPCVILFPLIALAIRLEGNGPILYSTERIGKGNRPIRITKFRTKNGTDEGAAALMSTLVDTKVGRMLRKSRLDELPQLINILQGSLSFIGPRPEMPALASVYAEEIPYYNLRHLIKPGLSGWAQISDYDAPRSGVDVARTVNKLSYDLYYLKHRSFLLDIEIALKTIRTFLMRTGT